MISCENISKVFSGEFILDSFSYTFESTGFYLLLGESGSGKTTFLNILSGFLPFDGGRITWNGRSFEGQVEHSAIENEVDYITQDAFFVDFLSVMDNMRLISENDEEIRTVLDRFSLGEKAGQMPGTLSGGEKQRLAIARAMLNGKKVLFLDEPTAALDEGNKTAIFELLSGLKRNVLIICSSHDGQAKCYADQIICFTKVREKAVETRIGIQTNKTKSGVQGKKIKARTAAGRMDKPDRFLKQWFRSDRRNRKATVLFTLFLVLSSCLCLLADTPGHKLEASMENLYKINFFTVITQNKTKWEEIAPDTGDIGEVVLEYGRSCPDGDEDLPDDVIMRPLPDYEMSLNVIPFDSENFKLSDNIRYGSYFTDVNQIILSSEMAGGLGVKPEKLIGEHITKKVYGLGNVDFEIVGIFDAFDDFEKMYLNALGISIESGDRYYPEDYANLYFVNSRLMESLEDDEGFYANQSQRAYQIYFDSYKEMKEYYDKYSARLNANESVQAEYSDVSVSLRSAFDTMFLVLLPVAGFMVLFATLFYAALKKTEFVYNNRFISVFEYSGYSKKQVINRFIRLNILEFVRLLIIAEAAAFIITLAVNLLNRSLILVEFQLFTYNILLIAAFNLFVILVSLATVNILFRRVRVSSWYENMIASRDLI